MKRTLIAAIVTMAFTGTAQAALFDRGSGLIYDDVLNVTWLQDANYAKTLGQGYGGEGGFSWSEANTWAADLVYHDSVRNVDYSDWRLPSNAPVNGSTWNMNPSVNGSTDIGYNITSPQSELAYMFYVNLGNPGVFTPARMTTGCYATPTDTCLDNTGPFINLDVNAIYWYGTDGPDVLDFDGTTILDYDGNTVATRFNFLVATGRQQTQQVATFSAWAVRDGDVAAVPEPETYALLLAGLGLTGFVARRRKHSCLTA